MKNIFLFIICFIIAILAYKTSIGAKELKNKNYALSSNLSKEIEKNQVLSAEWAYLNRIENLESLAENIKLYPPKPQQIARIDNYKNNINLAMLGLTYKTALNDIDENSKNKKKV
jgi:hypothetical protein